MQKNIPFVYTCIYPGLTLGFYRIKDTNGFVLFQTKSIPTISLNNVNSTLLKKATRQAAKIKLTNVIITYIPSACVQIDLHLNPLLK